MHCFAKPVAMAYQGALMVTATGLVFLLFVGSLASTHSLTPTNENFKNDYSINTAAESMGLLSSRQRPQRDFECPAACPPCPACAACPSAPPCPPIIPPGYKYYADLGYYKVHHQRVNWTRARAACEAEGGHLLVINSQEEADFASGLMTQYGVNDYYHIGFTEPDTQHTYVTIFDDLLSETGYFTWAPGEPNDPWAARCGAFLPYEGLDDVRCSYPHPFVCELLYKNGI